MFADFTRVARDNGIVLPRDLMLLAKSFVTVTSIAKLLDPDFDMAEMTRPHARRIVLQRYSPRGIMKGLAGNLLSISRLLHRAPKQVSGILRKMEAGKLQINFRHEGLENFMTEVDHASNRVSVSIILGAVVVGSSLVIHAKIGPKVANLPYLRFESLSELSLLGIVGYLFAGVLGLWVVWDIIRSGRY